MKTIMTLMMVLTSSNLFAGNFSTLSPCINNGEEIIVGKSLNAKELGELIGEDLEFKVSEAEIEFTMNLKKISRDKAKAEMIKVREKQTYFHLGILQCSQSDFIQAGGSFKTQGIRAEQIIMLNKVLPLGFVQHAPNSVLNDNKTFTNENGKLTMSSGTGTTLEIIQEGKGRVNLKDWDSRETIIIVTEDNKAAQLDNISNKISVL